MASDDLIRVEFWAAGILIGLDPFAALFRGNGPLYLDEKTNENWCKFSPSPLSCQEHAHSNAFQCHSEKLHIEPVLHEHWRALHDVEISPQLIKLNLKPEENLAGVQ